MSARSVDFDPNSEEFREQASLKYRDVPYRVARALEILERLRLLSSVHTGAPDSLFCWINRSGFCHTLTSEWEIIAEAEWALAEARYSPADAAALIVRNLAVLVGQRLPTLADIEKAKMRRWGRRSWRPVGKAAAKALPLLSKAVDEILAPVATPKILAWEPTRDFWAKHYACEAECEDHGHRCSREAGHSGEHSFLCDRW